MTIQPKNASLEDKLKELFVALEKYVRVPHERTETGVVVLSIIALILSDLVHCNPNGVRTSIIPLKPNLPELSMPELPPEEFIYLTEFTDEYRATKDGKKVKLFSDGCIMNILNEDKRLYELCAMREETVLRRWKIKPLRFIHYMVNQARGHTKIRNQCRRWLNEQEIKKNGNTDKILPLGEGI